MRRRRTRLLAAQVVMAASPPTTRESARLVRLRGTAGLRVRYCNIHPSSFIFGL